MAEMRERSARLTLPARPEYLRFARITGASLATRLGFSYDELEDLRLAVDEICFALMPGPDPDDGATIELRYLTTATEIEVEAALRGHIGQPALSELGRRILSAVVDDYDFRQDTGHGPSIWMRKSGAEATGG
jgi:serine/threonine-protein kinase RsbW